MTGGRVIVITGAMAAGKSTIAEALARRLPRSAHVRGDVFRRMVVNGRAEMAPEPSAEALRQLSLRYDLAAGAAASVQDVIIGPELTGFVERIRTRPRHLVVLSPDVGTLQRREDQRPKTGYRSFSPADLDAVVRNETARIGYWLDSSRQTPDETVEDILAHLQQAEI